MRAPLLSLAATACVVAACRTVAPAASAPSARETPHLPAERLMEACWEPGAPPEARVHLVFFTDGSALRQVSFDAVGGATPAVGRCAREVALSYPWPEGGTPERLVLAPPMGRPSGWAQLAYVALLAEDRAKLVGSGSDDTAGLLNPAPLVHACLKQKGEVPTTARFRVQTHPTHVDLAVDGPGGPRFEVPRTRTERCVAAVLGATAWPNRRGYELDFHRWEDAPPPATPETVAAYFPDDATKLPSLGADVVQEAMARLRPAVSVCWEGTLRRRPELVGGRSVQMVVEVDGSVKTATVTDHRSDAIEEAGDYLLDRCLLGALTQLRFRPPGTGPTRASYSWVFAHR